VFRKAPICLLFFSSWEMEGKRKAKSFVMKRVRRTKIEQKLIPEEMQQKRSHFEVEVCMENIEKFNSVITFDSFDICPFFVSVSIATPCTKTSNHCGTLYHEWITSYSQKYV
jgi:hypothetical protein